MITEDIKNNLKVLFGDDYSSFGRYEYFLKIHPPWLSQARPLECARILEIGCGYGSGSAVLASSGGIVDAIDIDQWAVSMAQRRADIMCIDHSCLNFMCMSSVDVLKLGKKYDFVIFYATLEHMPYMDRIASIRDAWNLLDKDGVMAIIDTPNSLWPIDVHTSGLPFFNWINDELAVEYCKKFGSPSRDISAVKDAGSLISHGRSMSYHDLEVALSTPAKDINFAIGLADYQRVSNKGINKWWDDDKEQVVRIRKLLMEIAGKGVHSSLIYPSLDIMIIK